MSSSGRKSWRTASGICRCCLAEGCFKMLSGEYQWLGVKEVYQDMLLDCFGLTIAETPEQQSWSSTRLICGVCITRIRDASNFKKQVVNSEKELLKRLSASAVNALTVPKPEEPKVEAVKKEHEEYANDFLDDPIDNDGDDFNLSIKFETTKEEDDQSDSDAPLSAKRKAGTQKSVKKSKPSTQKKESKKSKTVKKLKPSSSKIPAEPIMQGRRALSEVTYKKTTLSATKRNRLMKKNAIAVLEASTVCPFKWHRQNYLCFFCHRSFKDPDLLKQHTKAEHHHSCIKGAVTYLRRDELVKIDVTDIGCKLCDTKIADLTDLKSHLKNVHNKVFIEGYRDGLVPYKLQSNYFQCAVCSEKFQYFIKLNQHMNKHFGNYICEACGKSFLSQDRLRCHALSHGGSFKCSQCPEIFDSLTQKTNHAATVHKTDKSLKCFYCRDTFPNYSQRKKHHKQVHNIDMPEFKCPFCAKVFQIMSKMSVHVKEVHMREKNYSCNVCEQKFFSKNHVQKHMIKHYGERIHQCEVCKKSYARKQTLRDHMRIHNNDRRFVCAVCSQAFVQNNSLKLHMRVHHPDVINA